MTINHKLCINTHVVDPLTITPKTLSLTDVKLDSGTGKGIFNATAKELQRHKIPLTMVMGLGTDDWQKRTDGPLPAVTR